MTGLLDTEGTDPETSNQVAEVVREVLSAQGIKFVTLSMRYGIAHELQRRGLVPRASR